MKIEVHCDESGHELFSTTKSTSNKYICIGGIWFEAEKRSKYKEQIGKLRAKYKVFGEVKWNKVSAAKLDFYVDLLNFFFDSDMRFRCIVIDKEKADLVRYHQSDQELGFYKFYYQLLHHWIHDFNAYRIFLDFKTNKFKYRLHELAKVLSCANLSAEILQVQALRSKDSEFIQLADFMIGAVSYKYHNWQGSVAKQKVVSRIERHLGHAIQPTWRSEEKFNIFEIELGGQKL
jgi:hypothetical protein